MDISDARRKPTARPQIIIPLTRAILSVTPVPYLPHPEQIGLTSQASSYQLFLTTTPTTYRPDPKTNQLPKGQPPQRPTEVRADASKPNAMREGSWLGY